MALSSITGSSFKVLGAQQASLNQTPANVNPVTDQSPSLGKSLAFVLGGNTAGGINQLASFITTVAAGGTATIDLTNITNLISQAGIALARVKAILVQLLSVADDATNGTACSSVTLGNNGANDWISQANSGWFGSATSTLVIPGGGFAAFGTPAAAGVVVDSTHKIIKLTNNDGSNAAAVQTSIWGADV